MAAENILGKLIIEGANRAGGIAGGAPSLGSGLAGGGQDRRLFVPDVSSGLCHRKETF